MRVWPERVRVVDSHTGGEPTRAVFLPDGSFAGMGMGEVREVFGREWDGFRRGLVMEPRASEVVVGALVLEAGREGRAAGCDRGVVFFNNVGVLQMCGHGTMGVAETLRRLGEWGVGAQRLETPVGVLEVEVGEDGSVSFENVLSYRAAKGVAVAVDWAGGRQMVRGDVAWGGNWFFLVEEWEVEGSREISAGRARVLTAFCEAVKLALAGVGLLETGDWSVDHIELVGPAMGDGDARSFVLCPGGEFDRSPCGTGTSAKLACLFADGKIREGEEWRQESVTGSEFVGSVRAVEGGVVPRVSGRAFVTGEGWLVFEAGDPLREGLVWR